MNVCIVCSAGSNVSSSSRSIGGGSSLLLGVQHGRHTFIFRPFLVGLALPALRPPPPPTAAVVAMMYSLEGLKLHGSNVARSINLRVVVLGEYSTCHAAAMSNCLTSHRQAADKAEPIVTQKNLHWASTIH